ncbi:MAG: hypothetical protein LBK62_06030 [Treponema sp.]|jgi:hypothetical protein|nr:hypothetical protein [Treponema sp.]
MKMLTDLQENLFKMMGKLMEYDAEGLEGEKLEAKIKIHLAFNEEAKTAVANGVLMAKCVDTLYGIPASSQLPLIPKTEGETFIADGKRKALISVPRDDGNGGFKRHRENPQ